MKATAATIRRTLKARELPVGWRTGLPDDPEATVEVAITPLPRADDRSHRRFFGAGRGLFASAKEADDYIRRHRDTWEA